MVRPEPEDPVTYPLRIRHIGSAESGARALLDSRIRIRPVKSPG